MRKPQISFAALACLTLAVGVATAGEREPVLDVHTHALPADNEGPPPLAMCTPIEPMPAWDPARPYAETFLSVLKKPNCDDPVWSPLTDEEVMNRTLDNMRQYNVYGVLSGSAEHVARWISEDASRFYPGLTFQLNGSEPTPDDLLQLHRDGKLAVLAEITNQYLGIAPNDPRMTPYWALAEEHDIPVGIHVGTGPPGVIYLGAAGYRASLHSALTMEEVLVRHPRLRVYLMHAGYPLLDDTLALMYAHPQVYVGLGVIIYTQPRPALYRFLEGLVEAGFGNRIMYGSDQMVWPETIGRGIEVIEDAPFLDKQQKRDILYNNAARFLRLSDEEIARHHGVDP